MLSSLHLADTVSANQADWLNLSDATNVVRIIGILIPLLTALVTKRLATGGLKSVVTLALSVITAVAATLVAADGHHFAWTAFVNAFVNAFVPAIAAYYGLWKGTGVAGTVANIAPHVGIGQPAMVTGDKGDEEAGDIRRGDVGAVGILYLIGVILAIAGLLILLGSLLGVIATSWFLGLVLLVVGVVLVMVSGRGTAL